MDKDMRFAQLNNAFIFALLSLMGIATTSLIVSNMDMGWLSLIIGVVLVICSIPFYFLAKNNAICYGVTFGLNTLSTGFSIAAFYSVQAISMSFIDALLAVLIIAITLSIVQLFFRMTKKQKQRKWLLIILIVIGVFLFLGYQWILNEASALYSLSLFLLIQSLFYVVLLSRLKVTDNLQQKNALYSYGIYITLTVLIFTILTEDATFLEVPFEKKKKQLVNK